MTKRRVLNEIFDIVITHNGDEPLKECAAVRSCRIYCPVWVRFAIRDLRIMLWGICEFRENRCGGGLTILTGVNEMPLSVYRATL